MFENHGIDNSKKKKHNCQWKTHASDPEDKSTLRAVFNSLFVKM